MKQLGHVIQVGIKARTINGELHSNLGLSIYYPCDLGHTE
jgi:hypothetical protein